MTKYARSSLELVAPGNFVVEVWRDARLGDDVFVPDDEVLAGDGERRGLGDEVLVPDEVFFAGDGERRGVERVFGMRDLRRRRVRRDRRSPRRRRAALRRSARARGLFRFFSE